MLVKLSVQRLINVQPRYVSFSTTILTCLHCTCLMAVTIWFIYQLKYDSVWARWLRKVLQWFKGLRVWKWVANAWKWVVNAWKWVANAWKWIGIARKWIKDLPIKSWNWIRYPRDQFREKKLHLKRNFFWYFLYSLGNSKIVLIFRYRAFGVNNLVAHLNDYIDWECEWPEPYLLSRLIRGIVYTINRCWLGTKKALYNLGRTVRRLICVSFHTEHAGDDVEMGECSGREKAEATEEISLGSPAIKIGLSGQREARASKETSSESPAKNEFCKSLQTIFIDTNCVQWIMGIVGAWENEM